MPIMSVPYADPAKYNVPVYTDRDGNVMPVKTVRNVIGNLFTKNTFYNYNSGANTTSGGNDTAFGEAALTAVTSGSNDSAFGHLALPAVTSGSNNTGVGVQAGNAITTGTQNTMMGVTSGGNLTTGSSNSCFGYNSNVSSATSTNRGAFGAQAISTQDNLIQVGADTTTDVQIGRTLFAHGANGVQYLDTITASGATPVTLNTIVGRATFTGVGSIATGGNANLVINNSLVTANTVALILFQGGTFAAGSNPVINSITYGAGTITINMINTDDTTATGAAGVFNYSFILLQL